MNLVVILGIAVGLAMDAFAVAMACSVQLRRASPRQTFRLAFHFGLFQFLMPVVGWAAGMSIQELARNWDHWVAFGLLSFIGGKAVWAALTEGDEKRQGQDPTRGASLVLLSVATSIDALAVGFTFAMLQVRIWLPSAVIGVVTAAITVAGVQIGSRLGARFGRRVEIAGGLVLIAIGLKILIDHLG